MDLAGFMTAHKIDDAEMGIRIGKSRSRVSRYRRGIEPIPGDVVKQLVEMSDGEMTANELLGIKSVERQSEPAPCQP